MVTVDLMENEVDVPTNSVGSLSIPERFEDCH
jgi:hypothetical protein